MIKTVAFAPPRSSSSRPAPRKAASKRASGSSSTSSSPAFSAPAPVQPSVPIQPSLFASPSEPPTVVAISAAELRDAAQKSQSAAVKSSSAKASPSKKSKAAADTVQKSLKTAPLDEPVIAEKIVAESVTPEPVAAPKKLKIKRAKPGEISAESYGAKVSRRVELGQTELPEAEAPKKRLTKSEREARKQLMRPDEGLLQRLQRAATLVPAKKVAKPKGWRFDCGRCGKTLFFQTTGALCDCGAIAVKE